MTAQAFLEIAQLSRLNFAGTFASGTPPLDRPTSISQFLADAVDVSCGGTRYRCDAKSLHTLEEAIARFPLFPFPYYGLAFCLQRSGARTWTKYASEAIAILRRTTSIVGHHPNHDQALRELEDALRP